MKHLRMTNFILLTCFFTYFLKAEKNKNYVVKKFKFSKIKGLNFESQNGHIKIEKDEFEASVTAKRVLGDENCRIEVSEDSGILNIRSRREDSWFSFFSSKQCHTEFVILLPFHVHVKLKNGSGDLLMIGMEGNIDVSIDSGDIHIEKIKSKDLRVKTRTGKIFVSGEFSNYNLKSRTGNIELVYHNEPREGKANIQTETGYISLDMPKESKFKVNFKSGVGKLSSEFKNHKESNYVIFLETGVGHAKIKKHKTSNWDLEPSLVL